MVTEVKADIVVKPVVSKSWFKYSVVLGGPLLLIVIRMLFTDRLGVQVATVCGITAWMVVWWVTETISIAVTSLLPLILFPAFGVLNLNATSSNYGHPIVFLFLAGFIFALAMEKHRLHLRIALHIVKLIGVNGNKLVLGFMCSTFFVSMWVNNTAAVLLMLPIATSVLKLLEQELSGAGRKDEYRNLSVSILIGVPYAAVIGGMSTVVGSPTNLVMVGYMKQFYHSDVSFLSWILIAFPISVVMLIAAYVILVKILYKINVTPLSHISEMLDEKLRELGKMTFQEYAIGLVFIATALGWVFRLLLMDVFHAEFLDDTIIGIAGALLLFLIPDRNASGRFLLTWKDVGKISWDILLMFGGGLALAKAMEASGLIKLIGKAIAESGTTGYIPVLIMLMLAATFLTQFIGNTALNTIVLPIVFGIASSTNIDLVLFGLPVTFAVSFSYMFPMSTAPNALVFTGELKVKEMAVSGVLLSLFGLAFVIGIYSVYYCVFMR